MHAQQRKVGFGCTFTQCTHAACMVATGLVLRSSVGMAQVRSMQKGMRESPHNSTHPAAI